MRKQSPIDANIVSVDWIVLLNFAAGLGPAADIVLIMSSARLVPRFDTSAAGVEPLLIACRAEWFVAAWLRRAAHGGRSDDPMIRGNYGNAGTSASRAPAVEKMDGQRYVLACLAKYGH